MLLHMRLLIMSYINDAPARVRPEVQFPCAHIFHLALMIP